MKKKKASKQSVFSLLIFIASVWMLPAIIFAQPNRYWNNFSSNNGLSQNSVMAIAQTHDGYLWLATEDGLNKFDGVNNEIFRFAFKDSTSVGSNYLMDMKMDASGELWLASDRCLTRFNTASNSFINYFHPWFADVHAALQILNGNEIYVLAAKGALKLDVKKNKLIPFIEKKNIISLLNNKNNSVEFVTADGGYFSFSKTEKKISFIKNIACNPFLAQQINSDIVICSQTKAMLYSADLTLLKTICSDDKGTITALTIKENTIYITFENKILIYNLTSQKTETILFEDITRPKIIMPYLISATVLDNHALVVGTYNSGVFIETPYQSKFKKLSPADGDGNLKSSFISCFCQRNDSTYWIGSHDAGLSLFNIHNNTFVHYGNFGIENMKKIFSIYQFPGSENILTGCLYGLYVINIASKKIEEIKNPLTQTALYHVSFIGQCPDHTIWVGCSDGIMILDSLKHIKQFIPKSAIGHDATLNTNTAPVQFCFQDDSVWITKNNLLYSYNLQSKIFSWKELSDDKLVLFLAPAKEKQTFWLASKDSRIYKFNFIKNTLTDFNNDDKLPDCYFYAMQEDVYGNIWLSHSQGISKVNESTKEVTNYTLADGLQSNEFIGHSSYADNKGNLFFGGLNGFNIINNVPRAANKFLPKIVINQLLILDKPYNKSASIPDGTSIKLNYNQNFLTFVFSAIEFGNPFKVKLKYQLEGIDEKSFDFSKNNIARYTSLSPGNYTFNVWAGNSDDLWTTNPVKIHVEITPPFWATWWFRAAMAVAVAAAVYGLYRFRINRILAFEKMRSRISRDLHDDVGSTLSSINILSNSAKRLTHQDADRTKDYLENINESAQRMLLNMNDIIWAIKPTEDTLEQLMQRMQHYGADVLEAKDIFYEIDFPESLYEIKLTLEQKRNLFLIFKEALNNMAKYAACTEAKFSFSKEHGYLILFINDNGKGFSTSSEVNGNFIKEKNFASGGNGLINMKKRADEIKAEFKITSQPGKGTTVYLKIKL